MKTILTTCPHCHKPHTLCWLVGKTDRKLGVICAGSFREVKTVPENLEGIPEHFTPQAKKALQTKGNYGLPLMWN